MKMKAIIIGAIIFCIICLLGFFCAWISWVVPFTNVAGGWAISTVSGAVFVGCMAASSMNDE